MNRNPRILILLCVVLLAAVQCFAETPEYKLGEIVVKSDKPNVDDVTTVSEVTAEDIERRGATTLDQALNLLPGVYIRNAADGTPRIDIRGFRTRHIKLLVDGVPFQSTYDGQFDPSAIPTEQIARIKLTKGASSLLYGSGGTAAVINIITKTGDKGVHGSVGTRVEQDDAYLGKGSISGANDKGNFFLSGSHYDQNGYPVSGKFDETTAQDDGTRVNSDRSRSSVFFNGGYNVDEKTALGAVMSYSGGSYGKPIFVYSAGDPFLKNPKYERMEDFSEIATQLNFHHAFEMPLTLDSAVYMNQRNELDKLYDDANFSSQTKANSGSTRSTSQINGATMRASYDMGLAGSLSLGLTGEAQSYEDDGFVMKKSGSRTVKNTFSDNYDLQEYSSGLEYTVSPWDPLTFVAGIGYVAQSGDEDVSASDYTYLLGVSYKPFVGTTISANHARKVRFASVSNLFDPTAGNQDLDPEVAKHYELALDQELPWSTLFTGSVYRSNTWNLIEKNPDGIYTNYDKYLLQGFEVGLENTYFESLWVRTSYAYLHSEDKSGNSNRDVLQYRPRDTYAFEAQYTFPVGFAVYGSASYVANQYTYNSDETLKKRLDDFTIVNLKVSQKFMNNTLNVYAGVNNLFDEDYEESYGFPLAGRTLYCGLDYTF